MLLKEIMLIPALVFYGILVATLGSQFRFHGNKSVAPPCGVPIWFGIAIRSSVYLMASFGHLSSQTFTYKKT